MSPDCVTVELSWSGVAIRPWNKHDGCHHAFQVQNWVNSLKGCYKIGLRWIHTITNLDLILIGCYNPMVLNIILK